MIIGIHVEAAAVGTAGIARYVDGLVSEILDHPQDIKEVHLFSPHRVRKLTIHSCGGISTVDRPARGGRLSCRPIWA